MLINSEREFKDVVGNAQANLTWDTIKPFIRQADLNFIVPAIGEVNYNNLSNTKTPNNTTKALIEKLRMASGQYAFALSLAQMIMAYGDAGAGQNVQAGMASLPKWAFVEARKGAFLAAEKSLEDALVFIEANSTVLGVSLQACGCIIKTASEFSRYFPAGRSSRRLFLEMENYLLLAQNELMELIEPELWNDINVMLPVVTEHVDALDFAKSYIANRAVSMAVPYLNITSEWRVIDDGDGVLNEMALSDGQRNSIKIQVDDSSSFALKKLIFKANTLASATIFPTYFLTDSYKKSVDKPKGRMMNDPNKPYVVF